jgi:hypothetical protein
MQQWTGLLVWVLLFTTACNNATEKSPTGGGMAGGGCTYRYDTAIAEVVKINKIDTDRYDILFVLHRNGPGLVSGDTLHYAKEKKGLLSTAELKAWDVKMGNNYPYIVSTILSGACNPQMTQLVMEKMP